MILKVLLNTQMIWMIFIKILKNTINKTGKGSPLNLAFCLKIVSLKPMSEILPKALAQAQKDEILLKTY